MIVVGLDPGTNESAFVVFDGTTILKMAILPNDEMRNYLDVGAGCDCHGDREFSQAARDFHVFIATRSGHRPLAIEEFESFGMAVGREVFRTVFWSGRFAEIYPWEFAQVTRRTVKLHICGVSRATDANIRTALIDRFGGPEKAVGTKKQPGPLYGVKSHLWSALAIAVTYYDQHAGRPEEIRPGVIPEFDEDVTPKKKAGTSADF